MLTSEKVYITTDTTSFSQLNPFTSSQPIGCISWAWKAGWKAQGQFSDLPSTTWPMSRVALSLVCWGRCFILDLGVYGQSSQARLSMECPCVEWIGKGRISHTMHAHGTLPWHSKIMATMD